ncbi:MAG: trypsin-like peptidase domain-containing protein [Acidobacteriota bacterium]|nr:trypsin-like peptidase domain-containing protein [Acidobacteriota bacterium]
MERMIVKHISGSKANQVEEFALRYHNELTFGRDPQVMVKYDPDRDDLVGREHARITRDPNDPEGFIISDLGSRNGTYVNKQRIIGLAKLQPGDTVQFGTGGPEFQFDVEPRPSGAIKATRVAEIVNPVTPSTRVVGTAAAENSSATGANGKSSVGKATVERMISHSVTETKKQTGRKFAVVAALAAVALFVLFGAALGGLYWYNSTREAALKNELALKSSQLEAKTGEVNQKAAEIEKQIAEDKAKAPIAASMIADKYSSSVVLIENSWRLIHPAKKTQVYHLHVPTALLARLGIRMNTNAQAVPVYKKTTNSYEPVLVEEKGMFNTPIGGGGSGTGFIVTTDGFILTNRHVAATWKTRYEFGEQSPKGVLLSTDGNQLLAVNVDPPTDWVPVNTKGQGGMLGALNMRINTSLDYVGENMSLEVALPGKDRRMNAQLVESSDRHDVALMKIDKPGELNKVELFDNYEAIKKGEEAIIMGYPGVTARQYGVVKSQDMFNQTTLLKSVPNPTVTVTAVSNILRSNTKDQENMVISEIGDIYQLSTGSTGRGNSGGPVFDTQGRVIGIYFAFKEGADLQYVVPIRYGIQLME